MRNVDDNWLLKTLAWASPLGPALAGRLPQPLQILRVVSTMIACVTFPNVSLLEGLPSPPHFAAYGGWVHVNNLFERVRSVRIQASKVQCMYSTRQVAMLVDSLCSASLQAAELCACEWLRLGDGTAGRTGVLELTDRCGDRFAFEVERAEL